MNNLPAEKEADITRAIKDYLNLKGIFHFKHWGGPIGEKGIPDIIGVLPGGRALYIEIKSAKGRCSHEQVIFLMNAEKSGALAFVAHSLDNVIEKLKEVGI
jgi:hypothetical protein